MTIKPGDRVHCDAWLAHRPEGWEVRYVGSVSLDIQRPGEKTGWATVPIADCELIPKPFKVGDWVLESVNHQRGLVFAVAPNMVVVGWPDCITSTFTDLGAINNLTHIAPPEAPNA